MLSFQNYFLQGAADPTFLQELEEAITLRQVPKGQVLLRKGDKGREHYFVKSGLLRSYTLDAKGKEHIVMFAPEGWLIGDIGSFLSDKGADLYIDALEDSEVEALDNRLFSRRDAFHAAALNKSSRRMYMMQKRIISLMSAPLQERYLDFLEMYPNLVQRVPQKMIASYLGVTPEALSKLRGDLTRQKNA